MGYRDKYITALLNLDSNAVQWILVSVLCGGGNWGLRSSNEEVVGLGPQSSHPSLNW